ncbi:acyl carrier protein [Maribacter sp. 2210JD10-5]|uniref:acyl carrier protein n=1 Tax=Maribacter sp. 2210JD10-5 TaxID=3386272 RepID=UPI0039BD1E7F
MEDKIIEYITTELANEELEEDLEIHDDLLGSGLVSSLGMMKLVFFIENEYQIKVEPEDMTIENFMTVHHIITYLKERISS